MSRIIGWILLAVAAFMFYGYMRADVGGPAALFALLLVVGLPAAGGLALITGRVGGRRSGAGREELRRATLHSELLRLAGRRDGRLTIVEVMQEFALLPEEAKAALDDLAVQGLADFEVTDSGVVVYVFRDVKNIGDKHTSRGLLE